MLRLGLSSGALYPGVETEFAPAIATSFGFTDLEIVMQTPGEYAPGFIRDLKQRSDDAGASIHAVHTYQSLHPFASPYRRRTEEASALFAQAAEAANVLGARAVVWHGFSRKEVADEAGWSDFFRTCARLASICSASGVTLAIENVSWCALRHVRDVLQFAARIPELGPPGSIGFAFDPFQAAEAGANPFMILQAMEGLVSDVHLSDHREGHRHLPPGAGELPWPALIRAIANAGYSGPMMLEAALPDREHADAIRGLLDPLIAAAQSEGNPCTGVPPDGVQEGIRLFNDGKFYEAHEELEHEWHAERRPIRRLYQGILQIGVGFHHARGGNHRGAILLLTDGIDKVSGFLPACQGIDTARLVRESQQCLDKIIVLGPDGLSRFDQSTVPTVHQVEPEQKGN